MDSTFRNKLTTRSMTLLSKALEYRTAKHEVISGNLANIDTPGYKPKEATFSKALQREVDKNAMLLKTTHRKHFPVGEDSITSSDKPYSVRELKQPPWEAGQLSLDREMAKMAKNNLLYEASAQLLAKKFEALKMAIDGTGR
jgi:flagellar basal-body rod protein FlgB